MKQKSVRLRSTAFSPPSMTSAYFQFPVQITTMDLYQSKRATNNACPLPPPNMNVALSSPQLSISKRMPGRKRREALTKQSSEVPKEILLYPPTNANKEEADDDEDEDRWLSNSSNHSVAPSRPKRQPSMEEHDFLLLLRWRQCSVYHSGIDGHIHDWYKTTYT